MNPTNEKQVLREKDLRFLGEDGVTSVWLDLARQEHVKVKLLMELLERQEVIRDTFLEKHRHSIAELKRVMVERTEE